MSPQPRRAADPDATVVVVDPAATADAATVNEIGDDEFQGPAAENLASTRGVGELTVRRDRLRERIAIGSMALTGVAAVTGGVLVAVSADGAGLFLSGVFTPLLGVTATVVGFYFSSRDG